MKGRKSTSSKLRRLIRENTKLAEARRVSLRPVAIKQLKQLTRNYGFSVALGDLLFLQNGWYVTHAGLLRLATRRHCAGLHVEQVVNACNPNANRWVFRATAYKVGDCRGFVGYGDADPANVSELVRGAELRVAETRAVNRALRKAYGIGLVSIEELGCRWNGVDGGQLTETPCASAERGKGQPRLRDKLCLLIRQYSLDPALVKAYAADFCGTKVLSEASRESIERFISALSQSALQNRAALVCKLNSYSQRQEVSS